MKKLALLTAVIISVLVFSIVFATEENNLLIAPAPEANEENVENTVENDTVVQENTEITATEDGTAAEGNEAGAGRV